MTIHAKLTDYAGDILNASDAYASAKAGADDAGKGIAATVRDMLSASSDKKAVAQVCIDTLARRAEALLRDWHGKDEAEVKELRKKHISNVSAQWATCIKKECGFAVSFSNRLTPAKAAKGEKYETEVEPYAPKAKASAAPAAEPEAKDDPTMAGVDPRDLAASMGLLFTIHSPEHVLAYTIARFGWENGKVKELVKYIANKGGALVRDPKAKTSAKAAKAKAAKAA